MGGERLTPRWCNSCKNVKWARHSTAKSAANQGDTFSSFIIFLVVVLFFPSEVKREIVCTMVVFPHSQETSKCAKRSSRNVWYYRTLCFRILCFRMFGFRMRQFCVSEEESANFQLKTKFYKHLSKSNELPIFLIRSDTTDDDDSSSSSSDFGIGLFSPLLSCWEWCSFLWEPVPCHGSAGLCSLASITRGRSKTKDASGPKGQCHPHSLGSFISSHLGVYC